MTIFISGQSYFELLEETKVSIQADPIDELNVVWQYPKLFGQGQVREITLRKGLLIQIYDCQLQNTVKIEFPERKDILRYHFHLLGHHQNYDTTVNNREFAIYGSGCNPRATNNGVSQTTLEVTVFVEPETLLSFISDNTEQLHQKLQHLIRLAIAFVMLV